jgi:O-antigen/teichoic acid export membrane protein
MRARILKKEESTGVDESSPNGRLGRLIPSAVAPYLANFRASSPQAYKLAHGTFWSLIGVATPRAIGVLASIAVARLLGVEDFGAFGIIQSTIGMFATFAGYGLGTTAAKHIAQYRSVDPPRAGRVLAATMVITFAVGILTSLALLSAGPFLAQRSLGAPRLTGLLRFSAPLVFMTVLNGAQVGILTGFEAFKKNAQVSVLGALSVLPLTVLGTYFFGLKGSVGALAASTALTCVISQMAISGEARRLGVPLEYSTCHREWTALTGFSIPTIFGSMGQGVATWMCYSMLVNRPNGYGQMGLFNATNQWFAAIMFVPGLLGRVTLPALSESFAVGGRRGARSFLALTFKFNTAVMVPLVVVASLCSPWIMAFYGPSFVGAWPVLVIALITAAFFALESPVYQALLAEGKPWTVFYFDIGLSVAVLALTACFVDHGAMGLATARLLSYTGHSVCLLLYFLLIGSR